MLTMVTREAMRKHLPHVDVDNLGDRVLPLHSLYKDGEWHMWIPDGKEGLYERKAVPFEACYFAKAASSENDVNLFFVEFLHQCASYPETQKLAWAVYSDVQNLAASLAKLELIFSAYMNWPGANRMAATELEYIFVNSRSLFDLFQEIMVKIWRRIRLVNVSVKKQTLPSSYRRMVMHDEKRMSAEEIVSKHKIPEQIAEGYYSTSVFFEWLRQFRDYIAHSGGDFNCILVAENGFVVLKDKAPFSGMDIWCDTNVENNELGSLKSVACHVILTTLNSLDSIVRAFQTVIRFENPVVPEYSVFIRGPNINQLAKLEDGIRKAPWY